MFFSLPKPQRHINVLKSDFVELVESISKYRENTECSNPELSRFHKGTLAGLGTASKSSGPREALLSLSPCYFASIVSYLHPHFHGPVITAVASAVPAQQAEALKYGTFVPSSTCFQDSASQSQPHSALPAPWEEQ